MRTIKCQICGKEVEATSNRQKYCPECSKALKLSRNKKWGEKNKEKMSTWKKGYNEKNKEKISAQKKGWYEDNRKKVLARQKKWRENNKEYNKEYYESNKVYADYEGNNFCVYIHTDPVGKVYVGRSHGEDVKTVNRERWNSGNGYRGQKFYDECISVYGWNNIQHELLEWGLTYEEVIEREQYWIERYDSRNPENGYNVK